MRIHFVSHACFWVESGGKYLYFDPYEIPANLPAATAIFVSHDHHDHYDPVSAGRIITKDTQIVCPVSCTENIKHNKIIAVKPGTSGTVAGFSFQAIPAYNPAKLFHPRANGWCGYVVTVENKTLFHAGDTDVIPEFEQLSGKIDVAFLPVGDKYTMGFTEAVQAVGIIKPQIVVPMHFWDSDLEDFAKRCKKAHPDQRVEILLHRDLEL